MHKITITQAYMHIHMHRGTIHTHTDYYTHAYTYINLLYSHRKN